MKKIPILVICSIILAILLFVVFTKANPSLLTEKEALEIGEEKYLEFLWMVDGAFNNGRLDGEFVVNGKILDDNSKKFTCNYKNKNNNSCVGNNFEEEFNHLFSSNISYNNVYGDVSSTWVKYENEKYVFNYINTCSISRMKLEQTLILDSINKDTLIFNVKMLNDVNKVKTKLFVLVLEDDEWKISKAYYHDVCEIDYYVE